MRAADLEGRRVTVMGLGLFGGGAGVARYLARHGARITVTDLRDAETLAPGIAALEGLELELILGRHRIDDFRATELVVANPAVPRTSEFLAAARAAGVPITSETALFLDATPARVVAVTGTQGKSSTANFLAQLLRACGLRTHLGGNIGGSLLGTLDEMHAEDACVLELSSYQLESLADERARRGSTSPVESVAILNVHPDHLERHGTLTQYARAKRRILELAQPGGAALLHPSARLDFDPAHEPQVARALANLRVLEPASETLEATESGLEPELKAAIDELDSMPDFQRANLRFAAAAARALGVPAEGLAASFALLAGLPHRLEALPPIDGHPVWDNGVSTTPDSTLSALRALPPVGVLLAGGRPKAGLESDELAHTAAARAREVVLFGELAESWEERFRMAGAHVRPAADLREGVRVALELLRTGESLLFSPAAASFDAWPNWIARAQAFRDALADSSTPSAGHPAAAGEAAPR